MSVKERDTRQYSNESFSRSRASKMKPVATLIVDDHRLVREGVTSLLGAYPGIRVVAEAEDSVSALECLRQHTVDVVVLDIAMPGVGGVTLAKQLLARYPAVKVVALSMHSEPVFVDGMLHAGAAGYVLKSSAAVDLATAIQEVHSGRMYLSPEIMSGVVSGYRRMLDGQNDSAFAVLSDREREVAQLLAEGKSTADIANLLSISPKTVATHRKHIMDALGINSIVELTKLAIREKLVTLDI